MDVFEDISIQLVASFAIKDEEEKKAKREELSEGPLTFYLTRMQRRLEARAAVTARAGLPVERTVHDTPLPPATEAQDEPDAQPRPRAGYLWTMLLSRVL